MPLPCPIQRVDLLVLLRRRGSVHLSSGVTASHLSRTFLHQAPERGGSRAGFNGYSSCRPRVHFFRKVDVAFYRILTSVCFGCWSEEKSTVRWFEPWQTHTLNPKPLRPQEFYTLSQESRTKHTYAMTCLLS